MHDFTVWDAYAHLSRASMEYRLRIAFSRFLLRARLRRNNKDTCRAHEFFAVLGAAVTFNSFGNVPLFLYSAVLYLHKLRDAPRATPNIPSPVLDAFYIFLCFVRDGTLCRGSPQGSEFRSPTPCRTQHFHEPLHVRLFASSCLPFV